MLLLDLFIKNFYILKCLKVYFWVDWLYYVQILNVNKHLK